MKRPVLWSVVIGLLCGSLSFGQAKVPANLVNVVDTNFTWLLGGTNYSLYVAPTSRTENTAQHIFDWLDDRFVGFDPDAHVIPGTNIVGATYTNDQWWGLMPGTNIVGATYTNDQWWGLMPGTNIVGATLDTNTLSWEGLMPGTNIYGFGRESGGDTWYPYQAYSNWHGASFTAPNYSTNNLLTTNDANTYVVITSLYSRLSSFDPGGWRSNNGVVIPKSGMYLCYFYSGGDKCAPHACAHVVYGVEGQPPNFTIYGGSTNIFQIGNENRGEDVPSVSMSSWFIYQYLPSNTVFHPMIRVDRKLGGATNIDSYGMEFYLLNMPRLGASGADPVPPPPED